MALALLIGLAGPAAAQEAAQEEASTGTGAVLRGLDKLNDRTVDIELDNGQTGTLLGLDVQLGECRYPVDNPTGDAFAYLVIREKGDPKVWFQGWMIASSPALNALDHFRYDVWVLRCNTS